MIWLLQNTFSCKLGIVSLVPLPLTSNVVITYYYYNTGGSDGEQQKTSINITSQ
jgi:hypothetical protein